MIVNGIPRFSRVILCEPKSIFYKYWPVDGLLRTKLAANISNNDIKKIFVLDGVFSNPVTGLEWPTGFQEVKIPRFHDNGTGRW